MLFIESLRIAAVLLHNEVVLHTQVVRQGGGDLGSERTLHSL